MVFAILGKGPLPGNREDEIKQQEEEEEREREQLRVSVHKIESENADRLSILCGPDVCI